MPQLAKSRGFRYADVARQLVTRRGRRRPRYMEVPFVACFYSDRDSLPVEVVLSARERGFYRIQEFFPERISRKQRKGLCLCSLSAFFVTVQGLMAQFMKSRDENPFLAFPFVWGWSYLGRSRDRAASRRSGIPSATERANSAGRPLAVLGIRKTWTSRVSIPECFSEQFQASHSVSQVRP